MLLRCPECGKNISSYAKTCVNCGLPMENTEIISCVKCKGAGEVWFNDGYETKSSCPSCDGKRKQIKLKKPKE